MSMKVLVINSGSSSIKFELFVMPAETVEARGMLQRIGEAESYLGYTVGGVEQEWRGAVADHAAGLQLIMDALTDSKNGGLANIAEIGAVEHHPERHSQLPPDLRGAPQIVQTEGGGLGDQEEKIGAPNRLHHGA